MLYNSNASSSMNRAIMTISVLNLLFWTILDQYTFMRMPIIEKQHPDKCQPIFVQQLAAISAQTPNEHLIWIDELTLFTTAYYPHIYWMISAAHIIWDVWIIFHSGFKSNFSNSSIKRSIVTFSRWFIDEIGPRHGLCFIYDASRILPLWNKRDIYTTTGADVFPPLSSSS